MGLFLQPRSPHGAKIQKAPVKLPPQHTNILLSPNQQHHSTEGSAHICKPTEYLLLLPGSKKDGAKAGNTVTAKIHLGDVGGIALVVKQFSVDATVDGTLVKRHHILFAQHQYITCCYNS